MGRKKKDKLTGEDYLRYWEGRAAEVGPNYVGRPHMSDDQVHKQAQRFWKKLMSVLPPPSDEIKFVTEFGCGWGRMTNRLRGRYLDAEVWGIDMVLASIEHGQRTFPDVNFFLANTYHHEVPDADLLVTCTCLQHVTDPKVFQAVVDSFHRKVRPGGRLVMFENAKVGEHYWHLHELTVEDYVGAFHGFDFDLPITVTDVDPEPHFLLQGRRR